MAYKSIEVAREALSSINSAWFDYLNENIKECNCDPDAFDEKGNPSLDRDAHANTCWFTRAVEDCELYLYVRPNGAWLIDHAQYFQGGRVSSAVPLSTYPNAESLAQDIDGYADYDTDSENDD